MSTIASQELFALTPILEERMSEENHYSLNPRRRSKAGISQSNVVSNITSKEHSLVKSNFIPEKETWGTPGSIREVSHLDEVKSVESEREASTKIEDVRDSITDGVRDSVPSEPVVIVRPELNIVKKDLTIRHKKAISMVEHPSERKKSPKVMVDSALMSLRGSNLGDRPNLKKVQIGKAIGNLKVGTSEVWGQVFEKRKEKIPISHTKNASLGSAIPSLKIQTSPSKKSTKEEKKKIGSKTTTGVKTVESMGDTHRRTTSDFNYCTKSSQNLLNSARVAGKLFKANKTIDSKFEWKQGSPAKTLGSIKSDSSTSFSKKFAPTFADAKKKSEPLQTAKNQVSSKKELPKVIIEEQLKGLKKENLILKQENLNIKKKLTQNSEIVEKYMSLVNVIQQNMDILKYSVDTEIIMDYLEPFESLANAAQLNYNKEEHLSENRDSFKGIASVKKNLSGNFTCGSFSKKSLNNLSAKDLRQKVLSPSENHGASKDSKLAASLSKRNEKAFSAKDVRTIKQ